MSKVDVLLGLQWGDEGKGKIVDFLAPNYHIVARFQGGPNAGHTLEFNGHKHVLHQIPSGIFHKGIINVIGNGVVLDPITFQKEIEKLSPYSLDTKESIILSTKAQMILPTHRLLDMAFENSKGEKKIGSTLRGIGPTYQDKMARQGLRVGDLLSPQFEIRYKELKEKHEEILSKYNIEYSLDNAEREFFEAIEILRAHKILNTEYYLNERLKENKKVLAEGAQGSLLDIDFGSYPFVTSSNTISAGACTGLGISPKHIGEIFGVFKAYCTRVGGGPFPSELVGEEGEFLRKMGNEFGATTGRPRRCGWLDLPALNYAVMLNGVTQLFIMKVDVLTAFDKIKLATHYIVNGEKTNQYPADHSIIDQVIYSEHDSWKKVSDEQEILESQNLNNYLDIIEKSINIKVNMVSYGPDRAQTSYR